VGSADGPSISWMQEHGRRIALDLDLDALAPGSICGSALALPFRDEVFDVVAAFDVLEHCEPESTALAELARVLRPGGRLFLSVPAYTWAWSQFDVDAGHQRRYTRQRLNRSVGAVGMNVLRSSYVFAGTLPAFAAERALRKLRKPPAEPDTRLPNVSPVLERVLLGLCRLDTWALAHGDLPFGSSIVLAAVKL
jgi:SAM-dependent methyltransferase